MPKKYRVGERIKKYDPTKFIGEQAKGWMAEQILPIAEFLGQDPFREGKTLIDPYENLVELGKEEDIRNREQFNLPKDYKLPKGASELVAEQITPGDIALTIATAGAGSPRIRNLTKIDLQELNPLRSEIGAVGDITKLTEAEKAKKAEKFSRKQKLLLDTDLAYPEPKSRRVMQESPAAQKSLFEPSGRTIDIEGGFTGKQSEKTGTFGLTGPNGEKIAGKIHPDHIEMTSIGKGKAENSKSAVEALRQLGIKEGKPVYFTSTNLSESGGKFRGRMMERGELIQTDKGLQLKGTGGGKPSKQVDIAEIIPPPNEAPVGRYESSRPTNLKDIDDFNAAMSRKWGDNWNNMPPETVRSNDAKFAEWKEDWLNYQNIINDSNKWAENPPIDIQLSRSELGGKPPGKPPDKPPEPKQSGGEPPKPKDEPAPIERKATLFQNIMGLPKSAKTPFDIRTLRQDIVPALTHPIKVGLPGIKAGLKSQFGTEKMYQDVVEEIAKRPNRALYEKHKVSIPDVGIRQEYPSDWLQQAEKGIGIRGPYTRSAEGYDAAGKVAKANLFDLTHEEAARKYGGIENVPESTSQGIGTFVDDFTGYGRLGPLEKSADTLAVPFFSPRMIASRAQMLNPWNYLGGSRWGDVGKSMARRDMAKFVGGTAAGLGAIDYATDEDSPVDVEWDPRSSDFGSVQANNTTFDLSGGMRPIVNLAARLATGEAKSTRDDEGIYPVERGDTIGRFVRSKLAPGVPTMAADALFGNEKDFVGRPIERKYESGPFEDVPYLPWLTQQVSPMYPGDIAEAFEESGPVVGSIAAPLGLLGAGTSSYDRTPKRKSVKRKKN